MLISRRYVVEVDGAVASMPHAVLTSAIAEALTFAPEANVQVSCYWSGRAVWTPREGVQERPALAVSG